MLGIAMIEKSILTKEKLFGIKHIEIGYSEAKLGDLYNESGKY